MVQRSVPIETLRSIVALTTAALHGTEGGLPDLNDFGDYVRLCEGAATVAAEALRFAAESGDVDLADATTGMVLREQFSSLIGAVAIGLQIAAQLHDISAADALRVVALRFEDAAGAGEHGT